MRIVIALLILALPFVLSMFLKRRAHIPYALLTVGMLTYLGAFFAQQAIFGMLPNPLLDSALIGGAATAIVIGSTDMLARALGYQYLAKGVVNRAQATMIGVGHAFLPMFWVGFSLLNIGLAQWEAKISDDPGKIFAEGIINVGLVCLSISLSWLVLQTFLHGKIGWLFAAMFWSGVVAGTAYFLQHASYAPTTIVTLWWAIVAGVSLGIYALVRQPVIGDDQL
jgi:hypothetical protein